MKSKYNNKKVTYDNLQFDSKKERDRYIELKLLEKAHEISNLQCQVEIELLPPLREPDTIGKRGGIKKGKTIENAVKYIADFVYFDRRANKTVVEDVKSEATKTDVYIVKRKLFKHIYKEYLFNEYK